MAAVARHRSGPAPGWLAVMTTGASRASLESCAASAAWAGSACSVQASAAPRVDRAGRVCLVLCGRSAEHTSELQSPDHLVCRLLLEKKKKYSDVERVRA